MWVTQSVLGCEVEGCSHGAQLRVSGFQMLLGCAGVTLREAVAFCWKVPCRTPCSVSSRCLHGERLMQQYDPSAHPIVLALTRCSGRCAARTCCSYVDMVHCLVARCRCRASPVPFGVATAGMRQFEWHVRANLTGGSVRAPTAELRFTPRGIDVTLVDGLNGHSWEGPALRVAGQWAASSNMK